jgi:hypothetical protein
MLTALDGVKERNDSVGNNISRQEKNTISGEYEKKADNKQIYLTSSR